MRKPCECKSSALVGLIVALVATGFPVQAQANPYTDSLLAAARALAGSVPGERPLAVHFSSAEGGMAPISESVEGAASTRSPVVTPVFQLRYRKGWIMVDGAMGKNPHDTSNAFDEQRYGQIKLALQQAGLIVATHEHIDHVATLVDSPIAASVAPHTLLTAEQLHTLLTNPKSAGVGIDSTRARRYLTVAYDRLLPIAPGVVLVRTPGHTPGSQMVYVQLNSGRELLLAGDVAWHMAGVREQRQKPDSVSREMGEDRAAIAQQLAWLQQAQRAGVAVVISHDGADLRALAQRGVVVEGLDLGGRERGS